MLVCTLDTIESKYSYSIAYKRNEQLGTALYLQKERLENENWRSGPKFISDDLSTS